MITRGGKDMVYPKFCHPLINISVCSNYNKLLNRLSSSYVARMVAVAITKEDRRKLADIIKSANESEGMAALAGHLYEGVATALLQRGGEFPIRELHKPRSGIDSKTGVLKVTVKKDGCALRIEWHAAPPSPQTKYKLPAVTYLHLDKSSRLRASNKRRKPDSDGDPSSDESKFNCKEDKYFHRDDHDTSDVEDVEDHESFIFDKTSKVSDLPPSTFGLPTFRNLVGADVIVRPNHAFQMTVSSSHRVSISTFRKEIMVHMAKPVDFMFVVPDDDTFRTFKLQTFKLNKSEKCKHKDSPGGDCISCAEEATDLKQYVVLLPVPEFDWSSPSQDPPSWAP